MTDPIRELKTRAEILHKRLQLPSRRDGLTAIAQQIGFPNWPTAKAAIEGELSSEYGTLLYPKRLIGHTNHWYVKYEEAAAQRAAANSYLLAYKRHYFVADRYFVESLGLDPDDPDWRAMGFDWARPTDAAARTRLYGQLIAKLPKEAA